MSGQKPIVYVVEDDPDVRESLALAIRATGFDVDAYGSAESFLDHYHDCPDVPKCLVLDIHMPGLSGLGLQRMLAAEGRSIPTIMISGCADISTAVKAMSAGALDFLEKPVNLQILSARIREAIDCYVRRQRQVGHKTELARQMEKLSARQREVLNLLMAGGRCKQIARTLGIGEKTVAKHRATVLEKMQVDNVVELVRLFVDTDLAGALGPTSAVPCH
jgi:FixJ family two-component response regulator